MKRNIQFQNQEENVTNTLLQMPFPGDSDLAEVINLTVNRTLRELGFRGGDAQRVKRSDMVRRIGRKRYDRAIANGELQTYKNGEAQSAGVWAKQEDWQRFCRKYYL